VVGFGVGFFLVVVETFSAGRLVVTGTFLVVGGCLVVFSGWMTRSSPVTLEGRGLVGVVALMTTPPPVGRVKVGAGVREPVTRTPSGEPV
jgi:hypothetical protein